MTTGERIRKARLAANNGNGMTQKELGESCGIAEPTIRRYELGKLNPKYETLKKIASSLNVTVGYLQGDESLDAKKILSALKEGNIKQVEKLMGMPEDSIRLASQEDMKEVEQTHRNRQNESTQNIRKLAARLKYLHTNFSDADVETYWSLIKSFCELQNNNNQISSGANIRFLYFTPDSTDETLINAFTDLNEEGKKKAVEIIEIIAGNPRYKSAD